VGKGAGRGAFCPKEEFVLVRGGLRSVFDAAGVNGSWVMSGKLASALPLEGSISTDFTKTTWHVSGCTDVSNVSCNAGYTELTSISLKTFPFHSFLHSLAFFPFRNFISTIYRFALDVLIILK
jgi:hypothetical protein